MRKVNNFSRFIHGYDTDGDQRVDGAAHQAVNCKLSKLSHDAPYAATPK